jgi:hypothetical protein
MYLPICTSTTMASSVNLKPKPQAICNLIWPSGIRLDFPADYSQFVLPSHGASCIAIISAPPKQSYILSPVVT